MKRAWAVHSLALAGCLLALSVSPASGGAATGDGSFSFTARQAAARVHRGHTVTLSFELANGTTARVGRSIVEVWWPLVLDLRGRTTKRVPALGAGERLTVHLKLRVGRRAELGKQVLNVNLKVRGRNLTRTLAIFVKP